MKAGNSTVARLARTTSKFRDALQVATTEDIYEALRIQRDRKPLRIRKRTSALVQHLLASGAAPNTFLYETLLMAHSAPDGSADSVKTLLWEMRSKKLPWSSTAYHAALRVRSSAWIVRADAILTDAF